MLCEKCQEHEATVHLTQVVQDQVKKLHLCEACASESGFDAGGQGKVSITDLLLGMGQEDAALDSAFPSSTACPRCGFKRSDFKKSGRLGCPQCYEVFEADLAPLLKAMHRSEQHVGKVPEREGRRVRLGAEVAALEKALRESVAEENFEAAADYRDKIKKVREDMQEEAPADGDGH